MYADETYIQRSHTTSYAWDDGPGAGLKAPISKGRLIIVHVGNSTLNSLYLLAQHGHTVIRLPPYHPDLSPLQKIWGIVKTKTAAKIVTFKLRDVQQLAEQNFATVTMEEWAAVCRHVKAVEEEYMSREHGMDRVMERIIINADDDENDDMSESTISCDDNDDTQGVSPIVSDSE